MSRALVQLLCYLVIVSGQLAFAEGKASVLSKQMSSPHYTHNALTVCLSNTLKSVLACKVVKSFVFQYTL